jgi:hypothetical protein
MLHVTQTLVKASTSEDRSRAVHTSISVSAKQRARKSAATEISHSYKRQFMRTNPWS